MFAHIPPNIEIIPQNKGLVSISIGSGELIGNKFIPQATK
jgi:hypothetical protein